jgi:DNA polymerase-4
MTAVIIHLDMNSYFASVEQQDNPQYRGKVLGVCEHLGGIIIAASIEAKRWGIKTGMPVWEAKKLYPKIILVHTRAHAYREYHRRFLLVLREYSNFVEPASIDEAYADITKICNVQVSSSKYQVVRMVNPFEEAVRVAQEIKVRMKKEVGDYLTCSIGIAENKLLAKIGSYLKKPDGIVVITGSHKGNPCAAQGFPLLLRPLLYTASHWLPPPFRL